MNHLAKDAILDMIVKCGLEAMLVDTTDYAFDPSHRSLAQIAGRSGIGQKILALRATGGTLYGDDMKFPAVKSRVGAVVIYFPDQTVLAYSDGIVDSVKSPKGGDVMVPFSRGIVVL